MKNDSLLAAILVVAATSAGCVTPSPPFTMCETRANCPGGLDCIGGICRTGLEPDAGRDATGEDAAPSDPLASCAMGTAECRDVHSASVDEVDLLLLVDNSGSMTEEQQSLVTELPRLIAILSTGDRNGDGLQDFQPARSLHVGIVSSDMGTGSVSGIESCSAGFGDDGVMFNRGSTGTGCMPTYPSSVFDFMVGRDDAGAFATAVGCVASLGTDGCGFEQQLEAPLKAVSLTPQPDGSSPVAWTRPGYRPPVFYGSTFGHGGAGEPNDGFLRPDSVLAILVVTDEEDCSANDPSIFDRTDPRYSSVDLNLRCHTFVDAQYPVQRYVDGFIGLRSTPDLLVFAAIVGVPQDAVDAGLSYDQILALEEMTERIDPVLHNRLLPSCTSPGGRGVAYPPRRIVQVARGLEALGASTSVQSICNTAFTGAVDGIVEQLSESLLGACLSDALSVDAGGHVDCELYEVLAAIGGPAEFQHCADLPNADAYTFAGEQIDVITGVEIRREVCRVRQVSAAESSSTPGWFYDVGASSPLPAGCAQRIAFSTSQPPTGAETRLICGR
jgi:hypothetical protein